MSTRTRQYLIVKTRYCKRNSVNEFKLTETRLINQILRDYSDNGTCEVILMECTQKEFEAKFC